MLVLKERTVSTLGEGVVVLKKLIFQSFILEEVVMVMIGLIFKSVYFGLDRIVILTVYFGRVL